MPLRPLSLLLSFLFFCGGCGEPQLAAPAAASTSPGTSSAVGVSFLALGDSYTIGEGVDDADRWPMQLAALAQPQGIVLKRPDIIARTGWTTAELQAAVDAVHNPQTYDLVSLSIGVNNQYRGQSVAAYRNEFHELLRTAVRFAAGRPGRVFVLSIPDWGQSPAGQQSANPVRIGTEIDQFNAVAQDECRQAGIAYIDITPLTRAAAGDAAQFTRDGLHYSGPHMRQWAQQALPVVRELLK